jgi:hypothetical protein
MTRRWGEICLGELFLSRGQRGVGITAVGQQWNVKEKGEKHLLKPLVLLC